MSSPTLLLAGDRVLPSPGRSLIGRARFPSDADPAVGGAVPGLGPNGTGRWRPNTAGGKGQGTCEACQAGGAGRKSYRRAEAKGARVFTSPRGYKKMPVAIRFVQALCSENCRVFGRREMGRSGERTPAAAAALVALLCVSWAAAAAAQKYNAIFNFGDSITDTGNLCTNGKPSQITFTQPPYGETYFGTPTCRCSDGRVIVDFLSSKFGLPFLPPSKSTTADFKKGANMAITGATAMDAPFFRSLGLSDKIWNNGPISYQLQWFQQVTSSSYLGNSLFVFGEFGGNDYNAMLFGNYNTDQASTYTPQIVSTIASGVEKLIAMGATDIVVPGVLPIGCFPIYLTIYGTSNSGDYDNLGCLKKFNDLSTNHNNQLQSQLSTLQAKYKSARIMYADFYSGVYDMVKNPGSYGQFTFSFFLPPREYFVASLVRELARHGGRLAVVVFWPRSTAHVVGLGREDWSLTPGPRVGYRRVVTHLESVRDDCWLGGLRRVGPSNAVLGARTDARPAARALLLNSSKAPHLRRTRLVHGRPNRGIPCVNRQQDDASMPYCHVRDMGSDSSEVTEPGASCCSGRDETTCPLPLLVRRGRKRGRVATAGSRSLEIPQLWNDDGWWLMMAIFPSRNTAIQRHHAPARSSRGRTNLIFLCVFTCCGSGGGKFNYQNSARCGMSGASACSNPAAHLSWDGIHLTEAAYKQITDGWLNGAYCHPAILHS
ncbi:hypothetical protein HU200_035723 [Digitaria exilis]|uniref:GDSL esterase/lipase n=1 Tax=Digitaria exilis TaxID=1010633 RepID=A0A835ELB3_9POAL|nr:hypothetical protein HU200_035723 [Digitaria exilis]